MAQIGSNIITYTYSNENGCTSTHQELIDVEVCTSINDQIDPAVTIIPNPSDGIFHITLHQPGMSPHIMAIQDAAGRKLREIYTTSSDIHLNLSDFPSGIYTVKLIDSMTTITRQLVIQN